MRRSKQPKQLSKDIQNNFVFTPEIVRTLLSIEHTRVEIQLTVLPPAVAERLRLRARVRSTHFSTRIEGNRLTLVEAEQVLVEGRKFPGRERDTLEIQHYFQALAQIEKWVGECKSITEERICQLHALIIYGKSAAPHHTVMDKTLSRMVTTRSCTCRRKRKMCLNSWEKWQAGSAMLRRNSLFRL